MPSSGYGLLIHRYPILRCGVHVPVVTIYIVVKAACFNISRTHLSPGRELFAKTNNFLYRCPDDLVVTVYSMPPFGNGDTLVPLSAARTILDRYYSDIQHFERPYLSYWLLYRGHRPVVNEDFQRDAQLLGEVDHVPITSLQGSYM